MASLKEPAQADEESVSQLTVSITSQLGEPAATLIHRVIRVLGADVASALLERTLLIEQQGGMMLPDGTRRRTPGGVFFLLTKQACTPEQKERLFPVRNWAAFRLQRREKKQREREQAPPPKANAKPRKVERPQPVDAPVEHKQAQKGTTVKIVIVGRPASKVADRGTYVATILQSTKVPSLPKGLPTPKDEPTNYICYIATKQWARLSAALEADPTDALIIDGFPQINAKTGSIAVYATNATTKNLQRAAKKI
jgi:Phosphorylated adapter RNA export protein, RNA-binding domain